MDVVASRFIGNSHNVQQPVSACNDQRKYQNSASRSYEGKSSCDWWISSKRGSNQSFHVMTSLWFSLLPKCLRGPDWLSRISALYTFINTLWGTICSQLTLLCAWTEYDDNGDDNWLSAAQWGWLRRPFNTYISPAGNTAFLVTEGWPHDDIMT